MSEDERVNAAVLARLAWGMRVDLEEGIWESDASAESYASPHSMVFMCVPAASVVDDASVAAYLTRLSGLAAYFDAITERFSQAANDGKLSTRVGVTALPRPTERTSGARSERGHARQSGGGT